VADEAEINQKVQEILAGDISDADKIRQLFGLGYSRRSLTKDFGFAQATVYAAMPVGPDKKNKEEKEEREQEDNNSLPSVRKMGGGVEVLTPEYILRTSLDGSEQERWQYRGMMLYRAAMLSVMDLVNIQKTQAEAESKGLQPILQLLMASRQELDSAAARAKGSNMEIAQTAAEGAAETAVSRVMHYIDEKLPKGPPPKDTNELFTKRLDKIWEMMDHMMEQKMFPQSSGKPPEGWEVEKVSVPAANTSPPPQTKTASGWVTEKVKEGQDVQSGNVRSESTTDGAGQGGRPASQNGDTEVQEGGES
jgi:hypothetical protein